MAVQIAEVVLLPGVLDAGAALEVRVTATFELVFVDLESLTWDTVDTSRLLMWVDVDRTPAFEDAFDLHTWTYLEGRMWNEIDK